MSTSADLKALSSRLTALRAELLSSYPFFGRLLLHLQFGYASCGSAYTDMRRIVFDPAFAAVLSDEELRFVLLHELMHCVLHHCTRGRSFQQELYNIACDIVVNSFIMELLHTNRLCVAGEQVPHLAPDGKEGREYSADQIYEMLLHSPEGALPGLCGEGFRDIHELWARIDAVETDDAWEQHIRSAAKAVGIGSGIPYGLKRYLLEVEHAPTINWRQILHDFIRHDRSDFVYECPDHRYQSDVIMPSFRENIYGESVEKLWFLIDTSGSISDEALSTAFLQIRQAVEQLDSLSGELAFFDSEISAFAPIGSVEDLNRVEAVGGGGTSFHVIFDALKERAHEAELPCAIIIITDGFASFPEEEAALGVPVLWIIVGDEVEAPWGACIHI